MPGLFDETDFSGMDPIEAYKTLLMVQNNQQLPPDQAAANQSQNARDLLSIIPGPGNVIAGEDAVNSFGDAANALGEGRYGAAAGNAGLGALSTFGAVTGLPFGKAASAAAKGAGERAAVFLPIEGKRAKQALEARDDGLSGKQIWHDQKVVIGPEGRARGEISDTPMQIKKVGNPNTSDKLSDVIDHPELFDALPELRDKRVRWEYPSQGTNVQAKTDPRTGDFRIVPSMATAESKHGKGLRGDLAKLLQYDISERASLPLPKRHGVDSYGLALDAAAGKAIGSGSQDAGAYVQRIWEEKNLINTLRQKGFTEPQIDRALSNRNAGNADAISAKNRIGRHAREAENYPLEGPQNYNPERVTGNVNKQSAPFRELLPVPQKLLTPEEMQDFLTNWRRYGSGKP